MKKYQATYVTPESGESGLQLMNIFFLPIFTPPPPRPDEGWPCIQIRAQCQRHQFAAWSTLAALILRPELDRLMNGPKGKLSLLIIDKLLFREFACLKGR